MFVAKVGENALANAAVTIAIMAILMITPVSVSAGNLDSPAPPADAASAMHTLDDLHNRLTTGAEPAKRSGGFSEPIAGPGNTGHTLDEIMGAAPAPDNINGVTPAEVPTGKTFWGLRTDGSWGPQTGTNMSGGGGSCDDCGSVVLAPVSRTGQTTCYDNNFNIINCAGTGQDGELQKGVAWPNPRFTTNGDGTVTDNLTGLVWLRNASCYTVGRWDRAVSLAKNLAAGSCGLTDGSQAGDWRMPNINELTSLIDYQYYISLPNTSGTGPWTDGDPFILVGAANNFRYWSSTTRMGDDGEGYTFIVYFERPTISEALKSQADIGLWPVKGGKGADLANFPAPVARTGQWLCFNQTRSGDPDGYLTDCPGSGHDGEHRKGVCWPNPRFTNNNDGSVTDNLTGLVWLKNATCFGQATRANALTFAANLAEGQCGLSDGSLAGDWRIPDIKELHSLTDYHHSSPALSNTIGTSKWSAGNPFSCGQSETCDGAIWSNTTRMAYSGGQNVLMYNFSDGHMTDSSDGNTTGYVWLVRDGN